MNIFYLSNDPEECAKMHNDKHCIKMILEYAQLLSTAHRVIDGVPTTSKREKSGRQYTSYSLPDDRNDVLYSATHINHPSAIWVRQSLYNYRWLRDLWLELMQEYTFRYGKQHKCEFLIDSLNFSPNNIPLGEFTEPTPAMPVEYVVQNDSIASYRNYYLRGKQHLATWKGKINSRNIPKWYSLGCLDLMAEDAQKLGLGY